MARKSNAERKKAFKKSTSWLDEYGIHNSGMRQFLITYVKVGTITGACRALGFGVQKIDGWRKGHTMSHGKPSSPTEEGDRFEQAFQEAKQRHVEALEMELDRRAMSGSDNLLMFRLKALKPEIYRESGRTAGGPNSHPNPPAVQTQVNQLIQIGLQAPEKLNEVLELAKKHGLLNRLMGADEGSAGNMALTQSREKDVTAKTPDRQELLPEVGEENNPPADKDL